MKYLFYLILVLLLVPLQTTLLPHLSVWNIKPDLGLVAAALVGLFAGELEGLLVGLAIGWVLSLFSAGELWLSLLTNGGVGLLAGFLGRQVSQVTSISLGVGLLLVSLASGLFAAMNFKHLDVSQMWQERRLQGDEQQHENQIDKVFHGDGFPSRSAPAPAFVGCPYDV